MIRSSNGRCGALGGHVGSKRHAEVGWETIVGVRRQGVVCKPFSWPPRKRREAAHQYYPSNLQLQTIRLRHMVNVWYAS